MTELAESYTLADGTVVRVRWTRPHLDKKPHGKFGWYVGFFHAGHWHSISPRFRCIRKIDAQLQLKAIAESGIKSVAEAVAMGSDGLMKICGEHLQW